MKTPIPFLIAAAIVLCPLLTHSQEKGPQKDKTKMFVKNKTGSEDKQEVSYRMGILLEYFQLDHRLANQLIRKHAPNASDAHELREELDRLIDRGEASLLETLWVAARSGERAKVESVKEVIYPTGYEMPGLPSDLSVSQSGENVRFYTDANPTAFETRNVGAVLEVDPQLGPHHRIVNLNLAPQLIMHLKDDYFVREGREDDARGTADIRMPVFYTMRTSTQISVVAGNENFFGIHTPPSQPDQRILMMIKVDVIPAPPQADAE